MASCVYVSIVFERKVNRLFFINDVFFFSSDCLKYFFFSNLNTNSDFYEVNICYSTYPGLHLSVGNILGYNSVNSTLYGLSRNGLAIMESDDFGESWIAMADGSWSDIQSSWWFTPAERLDQEALSLLNQTTSQLSFASDVWNSSYSGKLHVIPIINLTIAFTRKL